MASGQSMQSMWGRGCIAYEIEETAPLLVGAMGDIRHKAYIVVRCFPLKQLVSRKVHFNTLATSWTRINVVSCASPLKKKKLAALPTQSP